MFLPTNITLKFGDSGDFVSELQRRLSAIHHFDVASINGFFDGVTVNAVSQFQTTNGIRADGIAGPETLRRLNGVISGETSTADQKAEEEEKKRLEQQAMFMQQQFAQQQFGVTPPPPAEIAEPTPQESLTPALGAAAFGMAVHAAHTQPTTSPVQENQPFSARETLANMLLNQPSPSSPSLVMHAAAVPPQQPPQPTGPVPPAPTAHAQTATVPPAPAPAPAPQPFASTQFAAQPQTQPQTPVPPSAAVPPVPPQPAALHNKPVAPAQPAHTPQQAAHSAPAMATQQPPRPPAPAVPTPSPAPVQAPAAEAEPQQSRGLVTRAKQFAGEFMQKLSNYFESKLPKPVIDEVKEIGLAMAKGGVRETLIPMGPSPQRGETPNRAQGGGQKQMN